MMQLARGGRELLPDTRRPSETLVIRHPRLEVEVVEEEEGMRASSRMCKSVGATTASLALITP